MLAPELNLCPRRSGVNAALNCDHFQPNKWAAAAAPNNGHWPRRVALAGVTTFICPGSGSKVPIPSLLPSRSISFVSRGLCRPVQACAGLCRPLWAQGSDALGSRQLGKLQGKERKCLTFRAAQDPFFAGGGGGKGRITARYASGSIGSHSSPGPFLLSSAPFGFPKSPWTRSWPAAAAAAAWRDWPRQPRRRRPY